jgi:hypothetical protein
MFLRRFRKRCQGKVHSYWALVESYRTAQGSRQRIVCYLGDLKPGEASGWDRLGADLQGKPKPSPSLFDPPSDPDAIPESATILPRKVRLENLRDFGDVWLALGLWRLLELDVLLAKLLPIGREEVPWAQVAAVLAVARFCQPQSELAIERTWYRDTALEDLLGVPWDKVNTDRLYACMDLLLPQKSALEKHLKERVGELFAPSYELLLYDVTSTYFEGECKRNPMAKRGHSRDHRPDCLQVCIGLVVTPEGLPLGYEVFAGNRHDSTTLEEIVAKMEAKHGVCMRIWVMDRGIASEKNLAYVRARQGKYIVGTPKAQLRRFEAQMVEKADWHAVENGVEVKLVAGAGGYGEVRIGAQRGPAHQGTSADRPLRASCGRGLAAHAALDGEGPTEKQGRSAGASGSIAGEELACVAGLRGDHRDAGARRGESKVAFELSAQRTMVGIPRVRGGLLLVAHELGGPGRGDVVEALHSVDGRGVVVSHHQG